MDGVLKNKHHFLKTFKNSVWGTKIMNLSTLNLLKIQFTNERLPNFSLFYYSDYSDFYNVIKLSMQPEFLTIESFFFTIQR